MSDNTNTASSADTSSVTAIKVKVVLDTTTEELKNQFKEVQNSFKKTPVEIAFGVNEGATIGNVNAALKRIVKKIDNPRLTLKIDDSNISAAVNKAVQKAQNDAGKASGTSIKIKADTKEATQKLKVFYDRVKEIGEVRSQLQDKLNQVRSAKPDDTLSKELENTYRYLQLLRNEAAELRKELGSAIPTGKYSKLSEISRNSPNRDRIDYGSTENLKATVMQKFYSGKAKQQSATEAQEIANTNEKLKEFYSLVKEIGDLNQKLSTADPSKQSIQIERWSARLSEANQELTNLMTTYSEFIDIGNGSKIDSLNQKIDAKNEFGFAKELDEARQKIQGFQKNFDNLELKLNSLGATVPGSEGLTNLRNSLPELQQMISGLQGELGNAAKSGNLTRLNELFAQMSDALDLAGNSYKQFIQRVQVEGKLKDESNHLKELVRNLQDYRANLTSSFNNSDFERKYEELLAELKAGNISFKDAKSKVLDFKASCHDAGLEVETLGQKLSRLFKEHFQTAIAMAGVAMVKQGLREVYDNVVEIDDAMVELRKVTKESENAYSQFSDRAAKTARDLGASISDYVSATADWSRLGYNMPDAEELARVSTLLKNVGDGIESVTDASSYMISVLKGFDLAAEDAQKVADLVNEVANNEPASAEDILEILTRSGAALHEAGNDLDQAVALGVAMNSVTQNAESTGQTLKTVSMYLRAAKTDLTAMGESTDGCANSVSELRSELKKLTGVDIMADAAGTQYKSTYDILMEISKVWGKLTDVDRANVTKLLGGKRNANSVSAVLSQFQIAEKSMKDAANSAGSAAKENEVYLTSITGKLNQLDAAFQQFSKDLLDSSLIKFFVDFVTGAVDLADGAVKAAGALPTLTAAISGVLSVMQMSGKLKNGAGKVNMPSYICCV